MGRKNWNSLSDVLDAMHSCGAYIILRNYEEIADETYYMSGHDDIDFLCSDAKACRNVLDVKKDVPWKSHDHCFVKIKNTDVKIGLRYVGDGYYDTKWEEDMISSRVAHEGGFYVMSDENYFYSLLYHALLQKKTLSEDYKTRLRRMGAEHGISIKEDSDFISILIDYLVKKGYKVPYTKDPSVPLNYKDVPEELLTGHSEWMVRRMMFRMQAKITRNIAKI